ncbi:MAG: hypothetical protein ABH849_05170 [Nanoarchaeota archaeon]
MRKYYVIIFVFLSLLMSSLVTAEVDEAAGFAWLNKTMAGQNWNRPSIDEIAISIIALRNAGYDVQRGVDKLLARKTGDSWQGNPYDTAWATLALYKEGHDVGRYITWLQANDRKAYSDGNWLIQILTDDAGACMIEGENGAEYGPFTIDGTSVSGCYANDKWIDVGACVTPVEKYHSFNVYCDPSVGISNLLLLFKRDSNYYLIDDSNPLNLENACYGSNSCDCETTGYTTWVLEYLNKDFRTSNYLETACDNVALQKAMLYEITEKNYYAAWLKDHQTFGQYWGNFYETAFVVGSLKQGGVYSDAVTSATSYLGSRQNVDGHWNSDIKTTAMILWRVYSTDLPPVTPSGDCDYDGICDSGESYVNCPSDCNESIGGNETGSCNNDGVLDPGIGEECDARYDSNNELISGHVLDCADDQKCVDCTCQDVYEGPGVNNTLPGGSDTGECTASDECLSDLDCSWLGACYYCDGFTCSCREDTTNCCESDDDCSFYLEECDVLTNTCVSIGGGDTECEFDDDCSTGYICEFGSCIYVEDDDSDEGGSMLWLWILILVLVIVGAGLFFLKKKGVKFKFWGGGKGDKKQTFEDFLKNKKTNDQKKQGFKPGNVEPAKPYYPPVKKVREDKFEKELDDSIKKARDLLRKK